MSKSTQNFWELKQPNKALDKIICSDPVRRDNMYECRGRKDHEDGQKDHEDKTSGSVMHVLVLAQECALLVNFPSLQYEENPGGRTGYPKKYWNSRFGKI
jgi:hypothetical protein